VRGNVVSQVRQIELPLSLEHAAVLCKLTADLVLRAVGFPVRDKSLPGDGGAALLAQDLHHPAHAQMVCEADGLHLFAAVRAWDQAVVASELVLLLIFLSYLRADDGAEAAKLEREPAPPRVKKREPREL
jgi:hypothetical protein